MFVLEAFRDALDELERMSWLIHLGLALMAFAFATDLVLAPEASANTHAGHGTDAGLAHLVELVGMACVLAGVAHDARRHSARARIDRAAHGGSRHAHR